MMKKFAAWFLCFALLFNVTAFATYAEDGGYGNNYGEVEDNIDEWEQDRVLTSDVYTVKGGVISGIAAGTTVGEALLGFKNNVNITVSYGEEALSNKDLVPNGALFSLTMDGAVCDKATATVLGDGNSDGQVTVTDITLALSLVLNGSGEKTAPWLDVNADGRYTVTDIIKMRKMILSPDEKEYTADFSEKVYNIPEISDYYKLSGRYETTKNGVSFDWSANTLEFDVVAEGDLYLDVAVSNFARDIMLVVYVDGVRGYDFGDYAKVTRDASRVKIAENLQKGFHTIKVVRDMEVCTSIDVNGIVMNGEICPKPQDKNLMIEVIGDSISCGNAARKYDAEGAQSPDYYSEATETYAYLTAENLNADVRFVTSSGKSLVKTEGRVSIADEVYDLQCMWRSKTTAYDSTNQRKADLVIINLGTNDVRTDATKDAFKAKLKEFAQRVKSLNKANTKVVFVYGMMTGSEAFNAVYKEAAAELGGASAGYYAADEMTKCTELGITENRYNGHPTADEHKVYAEKLTAYLKDTVIPDMSLLSTDAYVSEAYNAPLWEGNITYQENATAISENGTIEDLQMLYKIDRVIAVRSYDLKTLYEEGKDYTVTADGKLSIPAGSAIKALDSGRLIGPAKGDWCDTFDGKGNVTIWGAQIHEYQISVTYTHSDAWSGAVPKSEASNIDKVLTKLKNGGDVNIVVYGDSISAGWNASGLNEPNTMNYNNGNIIERTSPEALNIAPYAPTWSRAVYAELQKKYPQANINYYNHSCSSSSSSNYGVKFLQSKVIDYKPDIVFFGFGTNEATRNTADFKKDTADMVKKVAAQYPNCAIVLVSAELPNLLHKSYHTNNLSAFEEAYYEIQAENPNLQIAVAPVNAVSKYVNSKKRFEDITGNNINHPNDFGVRVYTSTVLQTLGLY